VSFHSFWTSGTRVGCDGQFTWCFNQTRAPGVLMLDASLNSGPGAGDCLLISRAKNESGSVVHEPLFDDCSARVSLACMSTNKPPTTIESSSKNLVWKTHCKHLQTGLNFILILQSGWDYCSTPVCSNFPVCKKNVYKLFNQIIIYSL
jgi:hypothetical protein